MSKERREGLEEDWPRAGELFIKHINTGEKTGGDIYDEIRDEISRGEIPTDAPHIGQASVYRCIPFFAEKGLITFRRKSILVGGKIENPAYWRLTLDGAQKAFERELISESELLQIIHLRDQESAENA